MLNLALIPRWCWRVNRAGDRVNITIHIGKPMTCLSFTRIDLDPKENVKDRTRANLTKLAVAIPKKI
jgi:hypothetical protein